MDLHSGLPYFLIKRGLPFNYPKLKTHLETDVLIVGGGISGSLMAYSLINSGIDAVVVDGRSIGLGSTASSTSLLQYEIDVPLCKLMELRGKDDAVRSFRLCCDAITQLKHVSEKIGIDYFKPMDSLYFAAHNKDIDFLQKEYEARRQAGFDVEFMEPLDIKSKYHFESDGAILSHHGAQIDAYSFTHDILQYGIKKGLKVFDRTLIDTITHSSGKITVKTKEGYRIVAKKMINATGYEVLNFIGKKIVKLQSTYALISEHLDREKSNWDTNTLYWNTADPYLYLTSLDNRIMIGGRDEHFYNPVKRDKLIKSKSRQLTNDFIKLFPGIPFVPEFRWAGTFGSTKDGLPYIGSLKDQPNVYYALGFGGNGITFSMVAAEIITDLIRGQKNDDASIFSFERT